MKKMCILVLSLLISSSSYAGTTNTTCYQIGEFVQCDSESKPSSQSTQSMGRGWTTPIAKALAGYNAGRNSANVQQQAQQGQYQLTQQDQVIIQQVINNPNYPDEKKAEFFTKAAAGTGNSDLSRLANLYAQRARGQQANRLPASEVHSANQTLLDLKAREEARCNRDDLKPYYRKTACHAEDATLEQMADSSKISDDEKIALSKMRSDALETTEKKRELSRKYGGKKGDAVASVDEQFQTLRDKNAMDLYEGKQTWGEYNKRRKELFEQQRDALKQIQNK